MSLNKEQQRLEYFLGNIPNSPYNPNAVNFFLGPGGTTGTAFSTDKVVQNLVGEWKKAYGDAVYGNNFSSTQQLAASNMGMALLYDMWYAYGNNPAPNTGSFGSGIPGLQHAPAPAPLLSYIYQRTQKNNPQNAGEFQAMMQQNATYASYCTAWFLATSDYNTTWDNIHEWYKAYKKNPKQPSTWPNKTPSGYPTYNVRLFSMATNGGNPYDLTNLYPYTGGTPPTPPPNPPNPPKPPPTPGLYLLPFLLVVGGAAAYFYLEHK